MVTLNGTDYRLCLLDTNALSEMVKREQVLRHFLTWSIDAKPAFVPCFSLFTVLELRRSPDVYRFRGFDSRRLHSPPSRFKAGRGHLSARPAPPQDH